ncbi:MAG: hypothetical protein R2911_39815 [Caldilineaceae bacterium]
MPHSRKYARPGAASGRAVQDIALRPHNGELLAADLQIRRRCTHSLKIAAEAGYNQLAANLARAPN